MTTTPPVSALEFDFETRRSGPIPVEQARDACERGRCCWIDVDLDQADSARALLHEFGVNTRAIEEAFADEFAGRHDVYDDCLHVTVGSPDGVAENLRFSCVHMIVGERFVFTLRRGDVPFLRRTRETYEPSFVRFAETLGFLLFQFWDLLLEDHQRLFSRLEEQVERVQSSVFDTADDEIFGGVAALSHDLLLARKNALANREVLHQMALHRSNFVSESTRPFLSNMVGRLERLGTDLAVERETLAETLNMYLGMVSHRTNRIVNRLTVISAIFLPLTFLVGVYGMNFTFQPEFQWRYGYVLFWGLVLTIVTGLLLVMRSKRWL